MRLDTGCCALRVAYSVKHNRRMTSCAEKDAMNLARFHSRHRDEGGNVGGASRMRSRRCLGILVCAAAGSAGEVVAKKSSALVEICYISSR
jgi:hypothetical protein